MTDIPSQVHPAPDFRLLYTAASPFARKVRIVAAEVSVAERLELAHATHVTTPMTANSEIAVVNPLVKIPTLVRPDGTMLYDSAVICEYLDHHFGRGALFPASGEARWAALRLMALADGMTELGIAVRYERARLEGLRWDDFISTQTAKIGATLDLIEGEVGDFADRFTIGQITLVCALDWLAFREVVAGWRATRPALSRWHARLSARPSIGATAPG